MPCCGVLCGAALRGRDGGGRAARRARPESRVPAGVRRARSEALERALPGVRDLEERVELRQLEQRLQVVVEVGQAELAALLANLLRQRHEDAEARAVDVARLAEVDEELALAALKLVEDLLLQLLSVPDDELAFDVDHDNLSLLLDREAHDRCSPSVPDARLGGGPASAWSAVIAATLIMSSETAPRERSLHGRARPWTIGPTALAFARRCTSL